MLYGAIITVTDHTKFADLLSILQNKATGFTTSRAYDGSDATHPLMQNNAQEVQIRPAAANSAKNVLVGDKYLAAAHYGALLASTSTGVMLRSTADSISLGSIFVGADADGAILHVLIEVQ